MAASADDGAISFDNNFSIRVLPEDKFQQTQDMQEACAAFATKVSELTDAVGRVLGAVDGQAARIEKEKLRAVGARIKANADSDLQRASGAARAPGGEERETRAEELTAQPATPARTRGRALQAAARRTNGSCWRSGGRNSNGSRLSTKAFAASNRTSSGSSRASPRVAREDGTRETQKQMNNSAQHHRPSAFFHCAPHPATPSAVTKPSAGAFPRSADDITPASCWGRAGGGEE